MEAKLHIRPAVAGEVASIVALDRATEFLPHWPAAEYEASLKPPTRNFAAPGIHRCLFVAESLAAGAVSELAGFAVGKVTAIGTPDATEILAELESVAVAAGLRRAGVGRALCRAVIDWSIQCGATAIDLEVRRRGEGPIALYRQLGFVAIGLRAKYYRHPVDDALLMRLEPGPSLSTKLPRKA
jgi:ribosomal-protein-alanine N-acetyltransferase